MRAASLTAALVTCASLVLGGCGSDAPRDASPPSAAKDTRPSAEDALNPGATRDPSQSASASTGISGLPQQDTVAEEDASAQPDLGVQVFSMWRDWETHEALMDEIVAAGSHWLRFDVGWCSLEERGPGVISPWYLERLDATVDAAEERGLSMLVTLTCSPTWARDDGRTRALPQDPAEYERVSEFLADRYRGRVAAWEMWNEPDCLDLGCANGSATAYVPVLKAGYTGIKAGDPDATVLSGGISGINLPWLTQMFQAGAGDYLDAVGLNSYQNPSKAPPDQPTTPGFDDRYRLTNVSAAHDLLTRLGHPDVPFWFTELGWSTGRVDRPRYDGVPPKVQARYLTQSVDLIRKQYPYVTHIFWFTLRDRDDSTVNENGFGLLELDGSPKPSYAAFKAANRTLTSAGDGE